MKRAPRSLRERIGRNRGEFKRNFWGFYPVRLGGTGGAGGRGAASALPERWERTKQNFGSGLSSWERSVPVFVPTLGWVRRPGCISLFNYFEINQNYVGSAQDPLWILPGSSPHPFTPKQNRSAW